MPQPIYPNPTEIRAYDIKTVNLLRNGRESWYTTTGNRKFPRLILVDDGKPELKLLPDTTMPHYTCISRFISGYLEKRLASVF